MGVRHSWASTAETHTLVSLAAVTSLQFTTHLLISHFFEDNMAILACLSQFLEDRRAASDAALQLAHRSLFRKDGTNALIHGPRTCIEVNCPAFVIRRRSGLLGPFIDIGVSTNNKCLHSLYGSGWGLSLHQSGRAPGKMTEYEISRFFRITLLPLLMTVMIVYFERRLKHS
jgi:hypothetical protein